MVSILCPAYNHEKYITQALDGFVMQKTSFPFEIIVHDDASTDDTANIMKKYESKFPHLFANIYQKENQFSKSVGNVSKIIFSAARGKYISLCEGDDYWTDPNKLQKQVDFLEANPAYSICTHNVILSTENSAGDILQQQEWWGKEHRQSSTIKDLLMYGSGGATCSIVFLSRCVANPRQLFDKIQPSDTILQILCARYGDLYYMREVMGVYRRHPKGIASALSSIEIFTQYGVAATKKLDKYFNGKYRYEINYQLYHYYYPNLIKAYKEAGEEWQYRVLKLRKSLLRFRYGFK